MMFNHQHVLFKHFAESSTLIIPAIICFYAISFAKEMDEIDLKLYSTY